MNSNNANQGGAVARQRLPILGHDRQCEGTLNFEALPVEVQAEITRMRGQDVEDCATLFVTRPYGPMWCVERSVDEIGRTEIRAMHVIYEEVSTPSGAS